MVKQNKDKVPVPLTELKPLKFVKPLNNSSSSEDSEIIKKNVSKARAELKSEKKNQKKLSSDDSDISEKIGMSSS